MRECVLYGPPKARWLRGRGGSVELFEWGTVEFWMWEDVERWKRRVDGLLIRTYTCKRSLPSALKQNTYGRNVRSRNDRIITVVVAVIIANQWQVDQRSPKTLCTRPDYASNWNQKRKQSTLILVRSQKFNSLNKNRDFEQPNNVHDLKWII